MRFTRWSFAAALLLGSFLALAQLPAESAVPGPPLPLLGLPTSVAGGVFLPSSGNAKKYGGNTQFDLDFRYGLPIPNMVPMTRTVIGLGVETGARSGNHSTVIPITATQLLSFNPAASPFSAHNAYVGAGLGVCILNQSGLSTAARIGAQAVLGYNITSMVFLEAKYQVVTHANGLDLDAGLRF